MVLNPPDDTPLPDSHDEERGSLCAVGQGPALLRWRAGFWLGGLTEFALGLFSNLRTVDDIDTAVDLMGEGLGSWL
jgi:hypothetical protein